MGRRSAWLAVFICTAGGSGIRLPPMKNTLLTLCLVLGFLPVQQPELKVKIKSFKNHKRFSVGYDKFKDQTTVTAGSFPVFQTEGKQSDSTFSVYARFISPGTETFYLGIDCIGRRWQFLETAKIYLLIDGERLSYDTMRGSNIGDHKRDFYITREWLVVSMNADSFHKLANGKSVEIKAGNFQTKLKDEHLLAFRNLLSLKN